MARQTDVITRGYAVAPDVDVGAVPSPCYVLDLEALRANLEILADVQTRSGAKILMALKGFAMWPVFDTIRRYLSGVATSSPDEARLGRQRFGGEVHAYAPAYSVPDFHEILQWADHVVLNSTSQWQRLRPQVPPDWAGEFGLRINPQHSEVEVALYDPCAPGSRLGITRDALTEADLEGVDGLHFHSLCELGSDALERTLDVVRCDFGSMLGGLRWLNMGGGHHITRSGYDREKLVTLVRSVAETHGVTVYLEPGEAIALGAGVLVASVLDIVHNDGPIAILDTSATAHMPDVIEMPYRPHVVGAGDPGERPHTYRLGGLTCLAGDMIGQYSFDQPLQVGDRLVFADMAHYTMVKNTTFNGVRLPSIAVHDRGQTEVVRRFGYEDYERRLG